MARSYLPRDPLAGQRGGDAQHDAGDEIGARAAQLTLLAEPLGFQHPGGERGVGTDEGGVGEQRRVPAQRQATEQAEQGGAADIDRQRSERKRPRRPAGDRAVHQKAQYRPGAAGEQNTTPEDHQRTRTRRTTAVARYTASSPRMMLAQVYPAARPQWWCSIIFSVSTCMVEKVVSPP